MTDRDVHADDALPLLIDDRVDCDRGLAGAAITDDQLALAAADRDHRVDRLEAGLQRLLDRLALDDARRDDLDLAALRRVNRAEAVHRPAERVDHPAHHRRADGHLEHARGAPHLIAFTELEIIAEDDGADVVFLEVQREARDLFPRRGDGEFEHLAGHRRCQAVDPRDSVLDLEDGPDLTNVDVREIRGLDFLEEEPCPSSEESGEHTSSAKLP